MAKKSKSETLMDETSTADDVRRFKGRQLLAELARAQDEENAAAGKVAAVRAELDKIEQAQRRHDEHPHLAPITEADLRGVGPLFVAAETKRGFWYGGTLVAPSECVNFPQLVRQSVFETDPSGQLALARNEAAIVAQGRRCLDCARMFADLPRAADHWRRAHGSDATAGERERQEQEQRDEASAAAIRDESRQTFARFEGWGQEICDAKAAALNPRSLGEGNPIDMLELRANVAARKPVA